MKQLIKSFLTLSRGDKSAFIILICIINVLIFTPFLYKTFFYKEDILDYSAFKEDILAFELSEIKASNETPSDKFKKNNEFVYTDIDKSVSESQLHPFLFNPNNLPTEEWQRLGLTDRQINGIKNYEAKGGRFYIKDDFKKMYVISANEYAILEPYIDLPSMRTYPSKNTKYEPKPIRILNIAINQADTTALKELKGIGSRLSARIINYRESLGGFVAKEQLLEVYGIDTTLYESIEPQLWVDKIDIKKININQASYEELSKHPYINRNVALSIINLRKMHGLYKGVADILKSELIDDNLFYKISPYLTTEE